MLFKPLFSNRKTNSFKIRKDLKYSNKVYEIHLSQYERDMLTNMLEEGIMGMRFILDNNIHDLKYLANYGSDKDNYGFYSLFGLGDALISVQNKFLINNLKFHKHINLFLALRDDHIDIDLLRDLFIEKVLSGESKNDIVKYYKNTNYYDAKRQILLSELLNKNVFELIKSTYQDYRDRFYKRLIEKFLSESLDLIQKQYNNDMFLYKNVITDKKEECNVKIDYVIVLTLHSRPKLYIGVSVTHRPHVYVYLNNIQYTKTLFVLFKVIGNDMKLSVYEYYAGKDSGHKDQYKLLLDIDLNNTEYYKNVFPEIKTYFDDIKNKKMSLISYLISY